MRLWCGGVVLLLVDDMDAWVGVYGEVFGG